MDRRQTLGRMLGIGAVSSVGGCRHVLPEAPAGRLDLVSPAGQLEAFLKIFVSRRPETIWYWYTGILDAAIPGRAVVPLLACDTLIRREVLPQPDGSYGIRTFEANVFRLPSQDAPLERFDNPLNGRRVEPLHYREGPHFLVLSERAPRFVAGADPARILERAPDRTDAPPFALRWQRVGSQLWVTRENYSDRPHPLDPSVWRLESSGARQSGGSFSNYAADAAAVASPGNDRVACSFAYQAILGWWPWLLMGQAPGYLFWRAQGRKLDGVTDVPAPSRAGFERLHPQIFAAGLPWTEPASMWEDFPRQRRPAVL
jgi:Protein of unknown function (DUF1838)